MWPIMRFAALVLLIATMAACSVGSVSSSQSNSTGSSLTLAPEVAGAALIGGSNYVLTSAGSYLTDPTEATWYKPGVLMPVIGTYHLNPELVRSQLRAMYQNGQRQIALFLWYTQLNDGQGVNGVYGHVVSSRGGTLSEQHKQNLRNLIADIENTGFTALQFRFANQGTCAPESNYQICWNFVYNTTKLVLSAVKSIDTVFDLDNESGGRSEESIKVFYDRLWKDFNASDLGRVAKTYGFSVAAAPGRLTEMVRTLDAGGPRPSMYAFTIYDDPYLRLKEIAKELGALGEKNKEIIIQETYYNDAFTAAEFKRAAKDFGIKIRCVMQWPLARGASQKHFSMNATPDFNNYGGASGGTGQSGSTPVVPKNVPVVESAGSGCSDNLCIWILGRNFASDSYVDIRTATGIDIIAAYRGGDRALDTIDGKDRVVIRLKTDSERALFVSQGLRVWITNPTAGTWSEGMLVRPPAGTVAQGSAAPAPVVTVAPAPAVTVAPAPSSGQIVTPVVESAGSGCADRLCIWIVGSGFASDSYVDVRAPSGETILASYRAADRVLDSINGKNRITIRLKTEQEKSLFVNQGLRVWVVNPSSRTWSAETLVKQ